MLRIFLPENEQNDVLQNDVLQNDVLQNDVLQNDVLQNDVQSNDQTIVDLLLEENPDAILIDLLDLALIGLQRSSTTLPIAAYDYWWAISILCNLNFNYWEAVEHIQNLPSGANDPIFIQLEASRQSACVDYYN